MFSELLSLAEIDGIHLSIIQQLSITHKIIEKINAEILRVGKREKLDKS